MRVWRARTLEQRVWGDGDLRLVWVWVGVCFLVVTVGPPSHWRLKHSPSIQSLCPPCDCYCSSTDYLFDPLGLVNGAFNDCGKHDPVMNEEMEKDVVTMLSEELNLQKIVANETLENTRKLITNARKAFSHYQKEAEKCNLGMETCEEARERAEAELIEERRLSALWEKRAREYGWNDSTDLGLNVTQFVKLM